MVAHCEVVGRKKTNHFISTLPFHVSSTLKRAEAFIKKHPGFDKNSWWEVRGFVVDCKNDDTEDRSQIVDVRCYNYLAKPITPEAVTKLASKFRD